MTSELSDENLVDAVAQGDKDAFSQLYARHAASLVAFLRSRAGNVFDVEDIAQETWSRIFNGLREGRFHPTPNFRALLFGAARNMMVDQIRRKSASKLSLSDVAEAIVESSTGLTQLVQEEELERLQRLIENLSDRQRDIVRLRLAGLSNDEVSEKLGLSRNQAYYEWHRIRETLRRQIESATTPLPRRHVKREINVLVDPGDAPATLVADLYAALGSLYAACGGSGLSISKDERRTFVREVIG